MALAVSDDELKALDDGPTDDLVAAASGLGASVLCARYSRAYVDLNRSPYEIDPAHLDREALPQDASVTPKVEVGLGVIPSRVAGRLIYGRPLSLSNIDARLRRGYYPYHDRLWRLVQERRSAGGGVILVDCHSMPSEAACMAGQRGPVDIAVGDRFGTSAHSLLVRSVVELLEHAGLRVSQNRPYAGGFITEHYGRPHCGMHTVQLEIRRDLFYDRDTRILSTKAGMLSRVLCDLVVELYRVLQVVPRSGEKADAPMLANLPRPIMLAAD
ncbi:N-formylglutamate amidohydrolase [Arboricoccus pini]|uniref:N-formylglutamate amidohydrolase n=1 Tax=Arboricoccus pini TaxID=1963835 RepID=A0A212R4P9_9PROT|nr:N-formylglutamate amidohydrolase [Arboricoccus pini]